MKEFAQKYINEVSGLFGTERAREHAYRPALHNLLDSLKQSPDIKVLNDPKRSEHGAPDFIIIKKELPVGYIETKDIGIDLDKTETSEQLERYYGYTNLILTDYLEFRFFRNGEKTETITVGKLNGNQIEINSDELENLASALKDFIFSSPDSIKSGLQLAKIMGGKARRIRDNVKHFLNQESDHNQELERIYNVIKKLLIHDLSKEKFADMYAQTLVYGLFIARYNDDSSDTFTRQEARDLVPDSNPFLKNFFEHIAGGNFDKRLAYIVNELCEIFLHSDVNALMQQYTKQLNLQGEQEKLPDPVIHFYEDFLKEYDPKQRIELGVFYTPLPVVKFIVRSIDELLKTEFGLPKGLADNSKIDLVVKTQGMKSKVPTHRVQVLDPATGTGTFLNEVINHIHTSFKGQEGMWKSYVNDDIVPRIYGFEIMIASYTIAHLKLGMTLKNEGYKDFSKRLGIYLTNSLEDTFEVPNDLFSSIGLLNSITDEAVSANKIKKDKPIMVVLGNPPYSGESQNPSYKGNDVYKLEPGTNQKLNERNPKWLNDDYVKFIRFAESFIERNSEGIIGMITAHGYLDNPTFRGMRWHLANTFNKIYILDLHGNANKKEVNPEGGKDENVFDIKTGVSIIIAVKTKKKNGLADVFVKDLFGLRKNKYIELSQNSVESIDWKKIILSTPNYEFVIRDNTLRKEYEKGFSVADLFKINGVGITTAHDSFVVDEKRDVLEKRFDDFRNSEPDTDVLHQKFNVRKKDGWNILAGWKNLKETNNLPDFIKPISYRLFDERFIFYEDKLVWRTVRKIMNNFLANENIALEACRQVIGNDWAHIFITNKITDDSYLSNRTRERGYVFPLYLFFNDGSKISNLKQEIVDRIQQAVNETAPEDIFDYIYAILHSPSYRGKYKEFLKIDFPRVPYPKNKMEFERLAGKGKELRGLHLLKSAILDHPSTTYSVEGSDKVEKVELVSNGVYINNDQYFDNVPEIAWNFYIGGYQPAQKWLKDRKGRTLTSEDIEHYQKIIRVLVETDRIMKEIDEV